MWEQPLHPQRQKVYIVSEEEDQREPLPVSSKQESNEGFEWLNSPANVYIY